MYISVNDTSTSFIHSDLLSLGMHAMSPDNRADYSVYVCSDTAGIPKPVSIHDAKAKLDLYSIAQVIGYYSACTCSEVLQQTSPQWGEAWYSLLFLIYSIT